MRPDIPFAKRSQDRIGQRMQPDIGIAMANKAWSCGTATPHSHT
jgi:hypothetical protein